MVKALVTAPKNLSEFLSQPETGQAIRAALFPVQYKIQSFFTMLHLLDIPYILESHPYPFANQTRKSRPNSLNGDYSHGAGLYTSQIMDNQVEPAHHVCISWSTLRVAIFSSLESNCCMICRISVSWKSIITPQEVALLAQSM